MSEATMKVLQMVADGKISAQEANLLLQAMQEDVAAAGAPVAAGAPAGAADSATAPVAPVAPVPPVPPLPPAAGAPPAAPTSMSWW